MRTSAPSPSARAAGIDALRIPLARRPLEYRAQAGSLTTGYARYSRAALSARAHSTVFI